jgi:hypothetical protein
VPCERRAVLSSRRRQRRPLAALVLAAGLAAPAAAERLAREDVPEPLRPWVGWAIRGHEDALCPSLSGRSGERSCVWPGRLALSLGPEGGRFAQQVRVDAPSELALPGDAERWPEQVRVDGQPAPVGERDGRPVLRLEPGDHEIGGAFAWTRLPALLTVPPEIALVDLTLAGRPVPFPERDELGRLWLRRGGDEEAASERRVEVEVYRKVTDDVPLRLATRIVLQVSGAPREERLGPALPPGFVPLALESPLPVRIEPDGTLRVQLRPGRFEIVLEARHEGPAESLALPPGPGGTWAAEEVWVFEARPRLRLVTVEGTPVDPQQTSLPGEWRSLPAYRMAPGSVLRLVERRRGDAEPAPDELRLVRSWHLDFDGGGATLSDRIEGTIHARSRLEMGEGTDLGRAAVNGADQFLTRLPGSPRVGIQVSPGPVTIEADGRVVGSARSLPAVGWQHDFATVAATLELPPGYELVHAGGVDRARWTWLNRWTLLDLFVALVVAVSFLRLYGPGFGALAALTLALTATEPGAPRFAWLAVLAVEGLRRVVPAGRFARTLLVARAVALAALVVIAVPYVVGALREGLYPALGEPHALSIVARTEADTGLAAKQEAAADEAEGMRTEQLRSLGYAVGRAPEAAPPAVPPTKRPALDPNARITTGPGVPTWSWHQVELTWSGPVEAGSLLRLYLLPPWLNALLAILRAVLVAALGARLIGLRTPRLRLPAVPGAVVVLALAAAPAAAAEFPPPELLEELRAKLLEAPACEPTCATFPSLRIEARPGELRLVLEVAAADDTALPLPGGASTWLPSRVLQDGAASAALRLGEDGALWLRVARGAHRVELAGPLPPAASVALPLPLAPHRATASLEGWTLQGLRPDGSVEGALQLVRDAGAAPGEAPAAPALPPFLHVVRGLALGIDWQASTWVMRLSPLDTALVVEIPLLPGESVTTPGVEVRDGRARVALAPGAGSASFQSLLTPARELVLAAPSGVPWSETWRVSASPIWHVTSSGIPPVQPNPAESAADFEWRPWPGETVRLAVERPEGVGGATLTIDSSRLQLRPGVRSTDAVLSLALRSSQGGEHRIALPDGALLQRVAIDGQEQPLRQEGRAVVVPLRPGTEAVELAWREASGIEVFWRAAEVDLGAPSVNAETLVEPPAGRWLLWVSGPPLGPAVLFWPVLAAFLGIALALAFTRLAPLRPWEWALLALGLTQVGVIGAGLVALWLLALGWRERHGTRVPGRWFDLVQLGLAALTVAALAALFAAIQVGLLGVPDMQVAGNGSSDALLRWYQDRSGSSLPRPRVVSLPIGVYRLLMLAWALWIAWALVAWLRFAWRAFSAGELWRPLRRTARRQGEA